MSDQPFRSGFISIIGQPNVGKSTLLNKFIGQPITITANKPQTTRNTLRGIITTDEYQAVFLDTPGIHSPQNELHKRIVNYALQSIQDSDLVLYLAEPLRSTSMEVSDEDLEIIKQFRKGQPVILVINKLDLTQQELLLHTIERFNHHFEFQATFPVSAKHGTGTDKLKDELIKHLPPGIMYYPEDQMTDTPERVIIAELVREQIMRLCFKEVPYGAAVVTEAFKENTKKIKLFCTIIVERETHKMIVIGKKGSMLRNIRENATQKIERMLGQKVVLSLHVKVKSNWFNNPAKLAEYGYPET